MTPEPDLTTIVAHLKLSPRQRRDIQQILWWVFAARSGHRVGEVKAEARRLIKARPEHVQAAYHELKATKAITEAAKYRWVAHGRWYGGRWRCDEKTPSTLALVKDSFAHRLYLHLDAHPGTMHVSVRLVAANLPHDREAQLTAWTLVHPLRAHGASIRALPGSTPVEPEK